MEPIANLNLCLRSLRAVIEEGRTDKIEVAERLVDEYLRKHPSGMNAIGVLDNAVDGIKTADGSPQGEVWFLSKEYIAKKRREAI